MNKNEIQEIKDLNHIEYQISDIKNSMVQFIDEKESHAIQHFLCILYGYKF